MSAVLRGVKATADRNTLAAFALTVVLFATNFAAVRVVVSELDVVWGAFLRFAPSALLLVGVAAGTRTPWPRQRSLLAALAFGALAFGLSPVLMYWALLSISAGMGSILFATIPLATFLLAVGIGQERFTWKGPAGAVLAIAGIALMSNDAFRSPGQLPHILAGVAAAASVAVSVIVLKQAPPMPPVTVNAVGMGLASGILLALALGLGESVEVPRQPGTILAVLWLILSTTVATVLLVYVLNRWTASATAYQTVLSPPIAAAVAAILLGEAVTWTIAGGGVLVLVGAWVGAIWRRS